LVRRDRIAAIGIAGCLVLAGTTAGAESAVPAGAKKGETLSAGSFSLELPIGLQAGAAYVPDSNPLTADKIALGRLLYFDPRFSNDRTLSCASCHNPYHGFADPARTSKGLTGKLGTRNSPTVINRLFSKEQFWDGRAEDLEAQAKGPLVNPVEMQMASLDEVVARVKGVKGYAPLFRKAFGDDRIDIDRVAQAIASYERTVVSGNSPYDRYTAGDQSAISGSAVRGLALFNGKANCKTCHTGFNFTDESYHNIGVGMDKPKPDLGRFDQTKVETDRGAFKTPTLRNVTETAPYMHDGSAATLHQIVDFYNKGGVKNPQLSKEIKALNLQGDEIDDLIAFLESLTGEIENAEPPASLPQ
jgi:cytochrome c peroxidase